MWSRWIYYQNSFSYSNQFLFLPKHFFNSLDKIISDFIWGGGNLGLVKIYYRGRLSGGLALPNLQCYYWAAHVHKLCYWLISPNSPWCKLELLSCKESSIPALLYSSLPIKPSQYTDSQVVLNTLKIWYQFRRHFKFTAGSSLCPLINNHLFLPSLSDSVFSVWHNRGIKNLRHLYAGGVFDSFDNLSSKYNLPVTHLFRYFQIRDFVSKCFPNFPSLPPEQLWENLLTHNPHKKGLIAKMYDFILALNSQPTIKRKNAWELELGINLSEDVWKDATDRIRSTTSCARLGLIQFKVIYRVHFSKSRLSEIYPESRLRTDVTNARARPVILAICSFLALLWRTFGLVISLLCPLFWE